jgi:hypothetical protein
MAKGNTFTNSLLKLIFNGTTVANLAENASSAPLANLYIALHTADPTASGIQTSNEIGYTGYGRVAVARTSAGFTVSGDVVNFAAAVNFPAGTGGAGTATYFSIGTAQTGTGEILYSGPISPTITCGNGVTPQLTSASTITES